MNTLFSKKELRSTVTLHKDGSMPSCFSCGLFKQCKSPKIPAVGTGAKGIMNVFDYPAEDDDNKTTYLASESGRDLHRLFKESGIDFHKDCVNVYAVRCKPYKDGEERPPSQKEIEACRVKLLDEVKKRKPKIIIAFGKIALQSLIGHRWLNDFGSVEKWRGWIIPDQDLKCFIAPMYSYEILEDVKKQNLINILKKDLQIALKHYNTPFPVQKKPEIIILKNLKPLKEIKYALVAFDYETTGLKPHDEGHKIVCASIAVSPDTVYAFMMPKDEEKREPFIQLLKNKNVKKMAHNMKFEETWSQVYLGTKVHNWYWDSMQAAHILDNRPDISSLKFQAYIQFGIVDYNEDVKKWLQATDNKNANAKNRIEEYIKSSAMNKELLLEYCALDSIYEYRLAKQQQEQFENHILPF